MSEVAIKVEGLGKQYQLGEIGTGTLGQDLYKSSLGVVVPTLYEAGSFPLVESILLKVPVICSNATSLPETVNNTECLFDPFSVESIAIKFKELWESEELRQSALNSSEYSSQLLRKTGALENLLDMFNSLENSQLSPKFLTNN